MAGPSINIASTGIKPESTRVNLDSNKSRSEVTRAAAKVAKEFSDKIFEKAAPSAVKKLEQEFDAGIRKAALDFLLSEEKYAVLVQEIEKLEQVNARYREKLKALNVDPEEVIEYMDNRNRKRELLNSNRLKTRYKNLFHFQEVLNAYLGQKIVMLYVVEGENSTPTILEMKSHKVLNFGTSLSNLGRVSGIYNPSAEMRANKKLFEKFDYDTPEDELNRVNEIYAEVIKRRFESSKAATKEKKNYLMWKENNMWQKLRVIGKGEVNEAYAAIILKRKTGIFSGEIEGDVGRYAIPYILDVDNMSGLLSGDVSIGDVEYGVKSKGASTLGYIQIAKLAKEIAFSKEPYTKERLLEVQKSMGGDRRNGLYNAIEERFMTDTEEVMTYLRRQLTS